MNTFVSQPYKIFMRVRCAGIENTEHVRRWKCPEAFLGADQGINMTSKLLKIKIQSCNMTFDPWKLSDRERQKGTIKWSNTLFADQKAWSRLQTLQQATYKWLPLGVVDWISGNDWRLAQPSQMQVTDYSTRVSRWTMQNPGVTREMRVSWKVWNFVSS